jgi:hypothetical protein
MQYQWRVKTLRHRLPILQKIPVPQMFSSLMLLRNTQPVRRRNSPDLSESALRGL